MRNLSIPITAALLLVSCSNTYHSSESYKPCKVLLEPISLVYEGECKDGLAHGKGVARGQETYMGRFKNGYPHGEGTYITYVRGKQLRYEGEWEMGTNSGFGTLYYTEAGKDKTKRGFWKDGVLLVSSDEKSSFVVKSKRGSVNISARKQGSGKHAVRLSIMRDAQNVQNILENFVVNHSSGTRRSQLDNNYFDEIYIENIQYPLTIDISYDIPNKMNSTLIDTDVEIEIVEPGNWVVELNNN